MSWFGKPKQEPAEAFAAEEQERADGLARRIEEITEHPGCASHSSLPHYQAAYRQASANAAEHTEQPGGGRRG